MSKNKVKEKGNNKNNKNKKNKLKQKLLFFLAFICLIFILDRITKFLSLFFEGCFIFCIKHSVNLGAAFNLLGSFTWTRAFLIIIGFIVLFLTALFYFKTETFSSLHIGLILLFAGTLGNLFDRIFFGHVIDFLTFSFLPQFPAFNLADVSNVAGVIILIWFLIKK